LGIIIGAAYTISDSSQSIVTSSREASCATRSAALHRSNFADLAAYDRVEASAATTCCHAARCWASWSVGTAATSGITQRRTRPAKTPTHLPLRNTGDENGADSPACAAAAPRQISAMPRTAASPFLMTTTTRSRPSHSTSVTAQNRGTVDAAGHVQFGVAPDQTSAAASVLERRSGGGTATAAFFDRRSSESHAFAAAASRQCARITSLPARECDAASLAASRKGALT